MLVRGHKAFSICSEVYSSVGSNDWKDIEPSYEVRGHELIQLTKEMHRNGIQDQYKMQMSMEMMTDIVLDLNKNFPKLELVDSAGGEVTIQKQFYPCLELLQKHPNPENIAVSFHTNFNTDFNILDLHRRLTPFKKSVITVSLDAGKNIHGYFRQGDWDKMKWKYDRDETDGWTNRDLLDLYNFDLSDDGLSIIFGSPSLVTGR